MLKLKFKTRCRNDTSTLEARLILAHTPHNTPLDQHSPRTNDFSQTQTLRRYARSALASKSAFACRPGPCIKLPTIPSKIWCDLQREQNRLPFYHPNRVAGQKDSKKQQDSRAVFSTTLSSGLHRLQLLFPAAPDKR